MKLPSRFKYMFRRNISLVVIAVLPFFLWCQENDSIQKKEFDNFFGSPCNADTVVETFGPSWRLELYSIEGRVCLFKKDKIQWESQIHDFQEFDNFCLVVKNDARRSRITGVAIVFAFTKDNQESRKIINLRNGRVESELDYSGYR
jgi:hypothetical protein